MPSSRFRQTLLVLTLAWLGIVAFAAYLLLSAEIARRERTFEETILHLSGELKNKLDTNEAVLAGFAAFLQAVERNDTESATRYAASATASYPHIYMLEVARQVPVTQEAEFQAALRREWLPEFTIKSFPGAARKPQEEAQPQKLTWPILFMYPSLPEAQAIYGVRLETVDFLGHSLALAHKNAKPVASPVFSMYEGGKAYILLQEVDRSAQALSTEPSFFGNTMTAMLVIRAESLIPRKSTASAASTLAYSASMKTATASENQLFSQIASPSSKLDEWLLPRFTRQLDIENATQPTVMHFEQQLQWFEVFNAEVLVIFGLLTFALISIPALTLRHLRALEHGAREHERSAYLATHDLLTGLPNRFLFIDRFEQAVQQHKRNGNGFALLLIDLDHFKATNDNHGHEVGDEILLEATKRMTGEIRACDTVARHGGDEFVVLLANTLNADDARAVGEKLLAAFSIPAETSAGALRLSCSIGIAMYPENGTTLDEILRTADRAMYQAKKQGRNRVSTTDADPASIQ